MRNFFRRYVLKGTIPLHLLFVLSFFVFCLSNFTGCSEKERDLTSPRQEVGNEQYSNLAMNDTETQPFAYQEVKVDAFVERWNGLSDLMGNQLEIKKNIINEETKQLMYSFSDQMYIKVYYHEPQDSLWRIEFYGTARTQQATYATLGGWTQVIALTNPTIPPNEVDLLFGKLHVAPNGDVSKTIDQEIVVNGVKYSVSMENDVYRFQATILGQQPKEGS
jgi:hypothetical protein